MRRIFRNENLPCLWLLTFCLLGLPLSSWASDENNCETESAVCDESKLKDQPGRARLLAGPEQVENRLDIDSNQVTPLFPSSFARGYFNWKDRIKEENGVGIVGIILLPTWIPLKAWVLKMHLAACTACSVPGKPPRMARVIRVR